MDMRNNRRGFFRAMLGAPLVAAAVEAAPATDMWNQTDDEVIASAGRAEEHYASGGPVHMHVNCHTFTAEHMRRLTDMLKSQSSRYSPYSG